MDETGPQGSGWKDGEIGRFRGIAELDGPDDSVNKNQTMGIVHADIDWRHYAGGRIG